MVYLDSQPLHEELYQLDQDPGETRNLATSTEHASTLDKMRTLWKRLREEAP